MQGLKISNQYVSFCLTAVFVLGCNGPDSLVTPTQDSLGSVPGQMVQARQSGPRQEDCKSAMTVSHLQTTTVLSEPWDVFNSAIWKGDGDQDVSGGYFQANSSASSAAADFISPTPIALPTQGSLVFSNRVQLSSGGDETDLESGALFLVNSDTGSIFNQYLFVNVGFTTSPNTIFVELFGSDNGRDFDQMKEIALPDPAHPTLDLKIWIKPNGYQVGISDEVLDSVTLTQAISVMNLFEVSVYGSRIDSTSIVQMTSTASSGKKSNHFRFKEKHGGKHLGKNGHFKEACIRRAHERIHHTENPSMGLRCLAKMKEQP